MQRVILMLALSCPAATAQAELRNFAPTASGQIEFNTPSGNIGCIYTPQGGTPVYQPADGGPELSCDRVKPQYRRYVLGRQGPALEIVDVGDASCCAAAPVLDYGDIWQAGEIQCESTRGGLLCQHNEHGFFISRKNIELW